MNAYMNAPFSKKSVMGRSADAMYNMRGCKEGKDERAAGTAGRANRYRKSLQEMGKGKEQGPGR